MRVSFLLSATALASCGLLVPSFALAADKVADKPAATEAPPQTNAGDAQATEDAPPTDIVITGSRIRSPNAQSNIPITSIAGDSFSEQARASVGDALNDLPQLASTFSQQNPGAGVGIAGLNLLDLRGLGTVRTLVLVNGRRHVGADILNNAVSVDVNTIPANLIERVDIVTGGNSAVYGSDAIAGVVNFVLKQNYDGAEIRGNVGVSLPGFGGNQTVSAIVGKNFASGRGNVTLSGEYSHTDRVFMSDLPWLRTNNNFAVIDVDPAGTPSGTDGFPDRAFFRDLRLAQSTPYGTIPINQQPSVAGCGTGIGSTNGGPSPTGSGGGANGVPYSCNYIFTDAGRLTFQTGTKLSTGINAVYVGGNGQTGREGQLQSVLPYNQRYNFNLLAHYTVAPAVEVFVEAKWGRTTSFGNASGPTFFTGLASQFDSRERVRLDNPFLNPADRTTLANLIIASGCAPSFSTACPNGGNLSASNLVDIASGAYRVPLGKQLFDVGLRDELAKRTTWRLVGGLRGTFWNDWSYEISGNYGKMTETIDKSGYVDKQRFVLSMDSGRNPVTGAIQCRSQFDPTAATQFKTDPFFQARLAADIAACVPYNPFGNSLATPTNAAARAYFQYFQHDYARMEQFDLSGFVSGNTGSFFNLPGGPIRFAIGGEYRSERDEYIEDPFADAGRTNALAGLGFAPPPFKVKEAYGELNVPILKDVPFFEELSLNGAARVSSYNSSAKTVWAYNYGGTWAPSRDIRFRAEYGRSVRAPNVSETAGALTPNFFNNFQDPCRAANIGTGSSFRAANCAADLGALLNTSSFANQGLYSLQVLSGSNPKLKAEKADSWTFGGVFTPRWVPNFTLSVDYYNIRVDGVITSVSAQQIANSCYDLPSLDNLFCANFKRFRGAAGSGGFGEIPGQIVGNSLIQAPLNFAKRIRKGIDVQLAYRQPIGDDVTLNSNLIYTHVIKNSDFVNPTDAKFEDRLVSELGSPKDEFVLTEDLRFGDFTLGYKLHYLSPMYLNTFEDFNSINGLPPQNADYADIKKYPSVFYHSIRFEWNVKNTGGFTKGFQFYAGVDNLLGTHPPFGLTGVGAGSVIYDYRGRSIYGGFRARF